MRRFKARPTRGISAKDIIVPVYIRNFESLSAINLPLTWSSDAVTLTDVTFDGTIVEYVDNKPVSIDNSSRRVQIGIAPTFTANVAANRGMLAKLHFSVSETVTEALVTIDTTSIFPEGGLMFIDEYLNTIYPVFVNGAIVIDTSSGLVCGRVIDELGNEISGATVELWDNFPGGAMMTTETTTGGGQFACAYAGVFPFDAYAYKEGFYPGLVEDIQFGELGIEIVLTAVQPITATPEWVNFYCDDNYFHNVPLPVGTVVDAYDPDGIHCGTWYVSEAGKYGFMPVYRDDVYTTEDEGANPGDEITFFINGYPANASGDRIWTENGDNFEVCLSIYDSEEKCIDLRVGWNLISWNVDLPADGINDIFDPIMDYVDVILGFDHGGMTYDPTLVEFSTLWDTDHFHGYWVKMNTSSQLCVTGTPISANTPIGLNAGWNLVSYLPDMTYPTPTALGSIHDDYLMVALGFDLVALTYDPTLPEYSTLTHMNRGFGYWLYSYDNVDLIYPGAGPGVSFHQDRPISDVFAAKEAPSEMSTSRYWMNVYSHELTVDGSTVAEGTEVTAVDAYGNIVGYARVSANGKFGFMSVYADDPSTEQIEGLRTGDQFTLVVDEIETEETFEWAENGARLEVGSLSARITGSAGLLPNDFGLAQNYPNPFNPSTTISFSVPSSMSATVEVYNILGMKVATVFDGIAEAGTNTVIWDGADNNGIQVASGVYFYRLSADNFDMTRKMVMMK